MADNGSRRRLRRAGPGAVVFDLDGTVADSQEGILLSLRRTLAEHGRGDDHDLRSLIGPPLNESFRALGFAEDELRGVADRYREIYDQVGVALARPYPGVIEVLRALRRRGVRLAVATAKRVDFAERMLHDFGVRELFDDVAGASLDDSLTAKVEIVAQVRGVFEGVAGGAWMVGDRRPDVEAARAFGLVPVGVLWGYGSRAELEGAGARWLIARPEELLDDGPGDVSRVGTRA
ncbi:MAG TPA: HAD hydrolase-like protein [Acidimicrobiales bacterium]|nr:HAD hydrolase-like protein [Acidimicrobiales bacterium]